MPARSAKHREKGQALLLVIVGFSLFLLGALGLAIDGAQLYAQRQMAQTAADSAAQAGIMSIFGGTNGTGANPFGTGNPPSSFTCTTTDGRTPCVYARLNGFGATAVDTVTITFPTAVSGVTLSSTAVPSIAVSVSRIVPGTLIRFLGPSATTIRARATAGIVGSVPTDCIYVLDPSASGAFTANNGATITSGCGIEVTSSSSSGGVIQGASVTAPILNGNFTLNNGGTSNPAPTQVASTVTDPYVSVVAPAVGASCDAAHTNYSATAGATINPGTFCGGISIANGVSVTFNPGIYVINGGSLSIQGGTTSSGSGVIFYLTGTNATYGSVNIGNGANVTLSAPTSGIYTGLLFFQDRSITSSVAASFNGGVALKLTGGLYFVTTTVAFSNGSSSSGYSIAVVAKDVSFTGGTNIFTYDPTGLKTGLVVKSVGLME